MIRRLQRWWYRFAGVSVRRDFAYMIDTDEYLLAKEDKSNDTPNGGPAHRRVVPDDRP